MPQPPETSSLLFACAERRALTAIRSNDLPEEVRLFGAFEDALAQCDDCILVLDASTVKRAARPSRAAIENLEPYLDPLPVTAAGGFVVREAEGPLEIVLIFRRGVWDLPKGKLDAGESIEECAAREVSEELGIENVTIERSLGTTIHGYRDGEEYAVKTTHWFAMRTEAAAFKPQKKENIERAEWVRLPEARERLGFETLRRHLDAVGHLL